MGVSVQWMNEDAVIWLPNLPTSMSQTSSSSIWLGDSAHDDPDESGFLTTCFGGRAGALTSEQRSYARIEPGAMRYLEFAGASDQPGPSGEGMLEVTRLYFEEAIGAPMDELPEHFDDFPRDQFVQLEWSVQSGLSVVVETAAKTEFDAQAWIGVTSSAELFDSK